MKNTWIQLRSTQNRQERNLISLTFTGFFVFKQFKLSIWHVLYLRMLDNAIKQTFIELSAIILVVFVWTSLENLSKSNVTFNNYWGFTLIKIHLLSLNILLNAQKFSNSLKLYRRTRNLSASVYIPLPQFNILLPPSFFRHFISLKNRVLYVYNKINECYCKSRL